MQTVAMNPGSLEPVTVDEVKTYARVASGDIEDFLIQTLIGSARRQCEEYARIAISPREWCTSYRVPTYSGYGMGLGGNWHDPEKVVEGVTISRAPVIEITSFYWKLRDGTQRVITADEYLYDEQTRKLHWREKFNAPPTSAVSLVAVYTAGYPADNEDLEQATVCLAPDDIKTAVMIQATHMYENRASESKVMLPNQVVELLRGYWQSASIA